MEQGEYMIVRIMGSRLRGGRKVKKTIALLLLGLLVVGLVGFVGVAKDTIIVGVGAPPRTMNPYGSDSDANLSVMSNIFDGLLQRDANGDLLPALATAWERVDALTWRFHLRKDVKFHNGNDFTWEDVKFSMERLKKPYPVSEFLAFGNLIASIQTVNGDPWTIDIVTTVPTPYFDQNLHQIFIMDKESTLNVTGTEASNTTLTFEQGWNLVGLKVNKEKAIEDVVPDDAISAWKWENNKWAVWLPDRETLQEYAASKGFAILQNIKPNEGFWVNVKQ
jgi:ABC-type transport system substrate-binding protein